jgi:plasmid stabilization system protein ParE
VDALDALKALVSLPSLLSFVAVYEVHDNVQILRFLHGAQLWPPHILRQFEFTQG